MPRYVALLRGVNVGTANRVAMADLRSLIASLGYEAPRTLLNSGNVVFRGTESADRDVATCIEEALSERLALSAKVVVLTAEEFLAAVAGNPLVAPATDPSRLLVGFLGDPSGVGLLVPLSTQDWSPERLAIGERVAYAWCPHGVADSPLLAAVARVLGDSITTRNWATVGKIAALLGEEE